MRFAYFKVLLLAFLPGFMAISTARGQAENVGLLEGKVLDAETQQPVVGVVISFEAVAAGQPRQQQKIGPTGAFRFMLVPGQGYYIQTQYYIRTELAGYLPTAEKFIVSSGYTTRLSNKIIYLKKGTAPRPVIVATPPAPASLVVSTPASATPITTTAGQIAAAPPVPATVSAPATTTRALPMTTPPVSATPRLGSATAPASTTSVKAPAKPTVPAPPVTVSAVQTQLRAVRFVQSKAELIPDSQPALDQLLTYMQENPTITIELAGHTDNQGNFEENLSLSRQRVDLVKTFLVQHGIASSRISSRGYGSTRPIASNNSEATRRLNRRVEMVILTK